MSEETATTWTREKIRNFLTPAFILMGLIYTYHSHITGCPPHVILGAWAIVPPVWFLVEYLLFARDNNSVENFDRFKHRQGLFRNVWLGIVVFLTALYLGKWD